MNVFVKNVNVQFVKQVSGSWLKPQLELKVFQLGSARDLFYFSSELKVDQKRADFFYIKVILKMTKLCTFCFVNSDISS